MTLAVPEPEPAAVVDAHEPETRECDGIGYVACSCGQWEAIVTGPGSARWAREQWDDHLRRVGLSPPR